MTLIREQDVIHGHSACFQVVDHLFGLDHRNIGIVRAVQDQGWHLHPVYFVDRRQIGQHPGIAVGVASSYVIAYFFQWSVLVSWSAILPAFLFAAAVGIFFGYYPARKASRLNPIEALRHE